MTNDTDNTFSYYYKQLHACERKVIAYRDIDNGIGGVVNGRTIVVGRRRKMMLAHLIPPGTG